MIDTQSMVCARCQKYTDRWEASLRTFNTDRCACGGLLVMELELIASSIATIAHDGQTTKSAGERFINHPKRVAFLVSEPAKPVAWLHDVLEDTTVTEDYLRQRGIPQSVIDSVKMVTRQADEDYGSFIERIGQSGDKIAIEVKLADLRDNLRPGCPVHLRERYLAAVRYLLNCTE